MKITFLGTGTSQGVPVIGCRCPVCLSPDVHDKRLRSSVLIESEGRRIVIDCGPDFRQQMLREDIRWIDAILVTHSHKDHLGGLDDVRAFNYFLGEPTDVFATKEVQQEIRREYIYAFQKKTYPGVPEIKLHTFSNRTFQVKGLQVIPIKSYHFTQDHNVFGFRIGDFTYITDAVGIPEKEKIKIYGSKVIVMNALRKKKHYSHFNLEEALYLMNEFKPEKGFLTHISHQMGLHQAEDAQLPDGIHFAFDGLTITFS